MNKNVSHAASGLDKKRLPKFVRDGLEAHYRATARVKAAALKQLGEPKRDRTILSAIKNKNVLRFNYNGKERIVEPQTYGISMLAVRFCEHGKSEEVARWVRCRSPNCSTCKRFRA
jgi:hypothetical protein